MVIPHPQLPQHLSPCAQQTPADSRLTTLIPAGNFSLAVFSMLQVSVGDGWAPYIVKPLVGNVDTSAAIAHRSAGSSHLVRAAADSGAAQAVPEMNRAVALFFMLYFFASGICLLGVVHAILLDEFMVRRAGAALHLTCRRVPRNPAVDSISGTLLCRGHTGLT
jgi:hypothetical protein